MKVSSFILVVLGLLVIPYITRRVERFVMRRSDISIEDPGMITEFDYKRGLVIRGIFQTGKIFIVLTVVLPQLLSDFDSLWSVGLFSFLAVILEMILVGILLFLTRKSRKVFYFFYRAGYFFGLTFNE